jgi:hypothetical protein
LKTRRYAHAGASVEGYALFAGGHEVITSYSDSAPSAVVDAYDASLKHFNST